MWIRIVKDGEYFRDVPKVVINVSISNIWDSGMISFRYGNRLYIAYSRDYVRILDNKINRLLYF